MPVTINLHNSSNVLYIQGRKVHNENFTTFLGPAQDCWHFLPPKHHCKPHQTAHYSVRLKCSLQFHSKALMQSLCSPARGQAIQKVLFNWGTSTGLNDTFSLVVDHRLCTRQSNSYSTTFWYHTLLSYDSFFN